MSTDPTSSGAQARKELGARLRQIRKAAGLTGKVVAEATGQHVTRVSRIENGNQPPTEQQIRDWCTVCGVPDEIPDLLATARSVETAYLEYFRQSRAGMRRLGGLHAKATYQRTTTFRIHEPLVLPGLFQTEAYHRSVLAFWYPFLDAPDDSDAVVALRPERTAATLIPTKRIAVVLGEQALRTRFGTPEEHADQLDHLLALMRLPFVSVDVIPADVQRHALATIGFWIFDNNAVALETPTAAVKVTRPQEIARYLAMFDLLRAEAVQGREARDLVQAVRASLDTVAGTRHDTASHTED